MAGRYGPSWSLLCCRALTKASISGPKGETKSETHRCCRSCPLLSPAHHIKKRSPWLDNILPHLPSFLSSSSSTSTLMFAFTTLAAAAVLFSVNVATAQNGGLSAQQQCLATCSVAAVNATDCNAQDTACLCASSAYATNVTQCATSTSASGCGVTADDVKGLLAQGCAGVASASGSGSGIAASGSPSSTASGSNAASSQSGKSNSAGFSAASTGVAAVSAFGLFVFALLV
ncbi:hypothetical protein DFH07DRAFT_322842 [Mycena maculata]|uniref:CFEM domain-containing protein n=1 Tax=Mycena maculata TaxID=230809 RepID=A0AAD7KBH4_9AGAR|nr:hypothetical protein DFH07DRAFT_322842 [Mycena maculata]